MQVRDALMGDPDPVLALLLMSTFGAFVWPESTPARECANTITPPLARLNQQKNDAGSESDSRLQLLLVAMVLAASTGK